MHAGLLPKVFVETGFCDRAYKVLRLNLSSAPSWVSAFLGTHIFLSGGTHPPSQLPAQSPALSSAPSAQRSHSEPAAAMSPDSHCSGESPLKPDSLRLLPEASFKPKLAKSIPKGWAQQPAALSCPCSAEQPVRMLSHPQQDRP